MDNRAKISKAAVRVFSREGFHRARVHQIAQEAGLAVGTIYNHFKSKEDLLLSVFEQGLISRMAFLETLGKTDMPVRDQIQCLLENHFAEIQARRELSGLMLTECFHRGSTLGERILSLQRRAIDHIAEMIRTGVSEGRVRPCHPRVVAQMLFELVQTMTACWLFASSDEAEEILAAAPRELADLIWSGLTPTTGAPHA